MYRLEEIAGITGSRLEGNPGYTVSVYLNDSRALQSPSDTLFIALKTARNDGHGYIPDLIKKGVNAFLVSDADAVRAYKGPQAVSFLIHPDPLSALQVLAAHHRRKFSIPVIGITGSNGKTVVKEWLYQLLKKKYSICRSPKSYNSQIGVPLSVLNLNTSHTLAVFEAGISRPGEMDRLAAIIQPTFGILTSIGAAHDEGFASREQKIDEKLKLFASCNKVVISGLDRAALPAWIAARSIVIGQAGSDVMFEAAGNRLTLTTSEGPQQFTIPFTDGASVMNAATCAVAAAAFGLSFAESKAGLAELAPVALRLESRNGINNCLIINDYYNSDLDSIRIALNYLEQQSRKKKKIVLLSDVEQSGISPDRLYRELSGLFSLKNIDLLVGIGREIGAHRSLFKANSLFFDTTSDLIHRFPLVSHHFSDASVLLKGARSFGFEEIGRLLQLKSHDTVFEIHLNRMTDNINYYRQLLDPSTRMMCMVKATGYGSGSAEIAKTLQHIGVDYLAVAYADEGVELRQAQVGLPIMVMSPEHDAMDDMIAHRLEPELYSFRVLDEFAQRLDQVAVTEPYPVHVKIDTGMHRLGFEQHEVSELCERLRRYPQLKVNSVFSHLAASDNPEMDEFTREQIRIFESAYSQIESALGYKVVKHICNSGAISRFPQAHYDMVRLGIGMYGIGTNAAEQTRLSNVGVLKTRISQIKLLKPGQTVGYNRAGKVLKETTIATLPLGYADGYGRELGNGRFGAWIHGQFCPSIGNICMDMFMVDVSAVSCREGDEAVIFENTEQIVQMAHASNTIPYEILTSVSPRVKRVYLQE